MPDPYEGIDFEEISEATGLAVDEIKCLKVTIWKPTLLLTPLLAVEVDKTRQMPLGNCAFSSTATPNICLLSTPIIT